MTTTHTHTYIYTSTHNHQNHDLLVPDLADLEEAAAVADVRLLDLVRAVHDGRAHRPVMCVSFWGRKGLIVLVRLSCAQYVVIGGLDCGVYVCVSWLVGHGYG